MSAVEFYRCERCGNIVAMIKKGGGTLSCCGQTMARLEANSTDAAKEKHVPAVIKENGRVKAAVGSTIHPMLPEHYIEWMSLVSGGRAEFKFLSPGEEPKAEFPETETGTIYAYCNLHGLWKADF